MSLPICLAQSVEPAPEAVVISILTNMNCQRHMTFNLNLKIVFGEFSDANEVEAHKSQEK